MTELAALLELLYRAPQTVERLACEYWRWWHPARVQAAFLHEYETDRDAAFAFRQGPLDHEEPQGSLVRLWRDGPDRLREEQVSHQFTGTEVRNGSRWWRATSLGGQAGSDRDSGVLVTGGALGPLLDPSPLLVALELRPTGTGVRAEREVVLVEAERRPRPQRETMMGTLSGLGTGADAYRLEVDAERGVLLRSEAVFCGEPFQLFEARQIDFEPTVDQSLFDPEPPPEVANRPSPDPAALPQTLPLEEAAARADFRVYVLPEVPPDWRVEASFMPAPAASGRGSSVHLNYSSRNASVALGVSESGDAIALGPGVGSNNPPWRDVEAHGLRFRVRSFDRARSGRGQVQVAVQRGDTFLQLVSDQFTEERVIELAAELEPYAPTSDL